MADEDEIKALTAELEQLMAEATTPEPNSANAARQAEIRDRLTALGRPVG